MIETYIYMRVCVEGIRTEVDQLPRIHKAPDPNFYKTALKETRAPQMTRSQRGGKGKCAEQSQWQAVRKFSESEGSKEGGLNFTVLQYQPTTTHWLKHNLPVRADTRRQEEPRYFLIAECQLMKVKDMKELENSHLAAII